MKLKQWLYGAAALAMLAACSDKDIAPGGGGENEPNSGSTSGGYIAVQINLPQDSGTRAEDDDPTPKPGGNDNFNDGTANEYNVDNAMIIIFKGKDEENATFCKAQDLQRPWFTNKPTTDQITSSYLAAVKVNDITQAEKKAGIKYWGLVILNRNEESTSITTDETADVLENTEEVTIGGTKIDTTKTFADVQSIITQNSFLTATTVTENGESKVKYSNFFMTNAPLSDVAGGGSSEEPSVDNVHYLVDLGSDTYTTIEDARTHVENCIYVERAVAKVTCTDNGNYPLKLIGENGELTTGYKIKAEVEYALTNTNKKSYVVRNVDFPDKHFKWNYSVSNYMRMVGELAMPKLESPYHNVKKSFYRTYWCYDPNYEKKMPADEKHVFDPEKNSTDVFVSIKDSPLYCKENTFDVKNQSYFNTTMAIFKVNFSVVTNNKDEALIGDGNLYIKNEDTSVIYVSSKAAASQEITRIKNDTKILYALEEATKASDKTSIENATKYLNIAFAPNDKNYLMCTSITLNTDEDGFNEAGVNKFEEIMAQDDYKSELIKNVNKMSDITYYKDGVSYYLQPIMHFGQVHCPLPDNFTGTTTKEVYNGNVEFDPGDSDTATEHARKYLGRYGMVRNNWYELNISYIKELGSPKVPEINIDLSDDNNEVKRYIGVEIHVLSWAKRTQDVHF